MIAPARCRPRRSRRAAVSRPRICPRSVSARVISMRCSSCEPTLNAGTTRIGRLCCSTRGGNASPSRTEAGRVRRSPRRSETPATPRNIPPPLDRGAATCGGPSTPRQYLRDARGLIEESVDLQRVEHQFLTSRTSPARSAFPLANFRHMTSPSAPPSATARASRYDGTLWRQKRRGRDPDRPLAPTR